MSQLSMPHANSTDRDSRFIAQHILLALAVATWSVALINSMVQDLPDWTFRIKVTFLACLSQVPGLLLAYLGPKRHGVRHILLATAFFISVTALLAYGMYAASGPADSLNSASHMHVIVFPVTHCVVAVFLYGLAAFLISICTRSTL